MAAALVCFITLTTASSPIGAASYKFCAFRDGPQGPCTCKSDKDGAGQFTTVDKSRCRKSPQQPGTDPNAPAGQTAATPSAVAPAPATSAPGSETPPAPASSTDVAAQPVTAAAQQAAIAGLPQGRKLEEVRARGKLLCGVNTSLLGFAKQTGAGVWAGLDVDFCRAVAAAVFADPGKVEFVPLETNARFDALKSGKVDLLSRNTTWTMSREVDLGVEFAGALYFDGQGFLTSDERGLVSAQQLAGLKVCVEAGTTSQSNMAYYFKAHQIEAETKAFNTRDEMLKAYVAGACDAYSGDRSALYADRAAMSEPVKHTILPEVISKEPLSPLVQAGDREWAQIVRWTLAALINAEEVGLDRASAAAAGPLGDDAQRLVDGAGTSGEKLRLAKTWLRDVIASAGHYGEIFEANLGKSSPLGMSRGINALWKRGGIVYAPPMW